MSPSVKCASHFVCYRIISFVCYRCMYQYQRSSGTVITIRQVTSSHINIMMLMIKCLLLYYYFRWIRPPQSCHHTWISVLFYKQGPLQLRVPGFFAHWYHICSSPPWSHTTVWELILQAISPCLSVKACLHEISLSQLFNTFCGTKSCDQGIILYEFVLVILRCKQSF